MVHSMTAPLAQRALQEQPQNPPILLRERIGAVALLVLNRPAARNCLSEALIAELTAALDAIRDDAEARAVVIAANGPVFSSGHDLKELSARRSDADGGRAYFAQIMDACSAMMQTIVRLPKPVVAAVQGIATAAGCQLVASCDLAVASERASFATPGVDIGLFCSTPMVALTRNVPRKHAMHMLLTGQPVAAETARTMGLINTVAAPGTEREIAVELAASIARKSAHTIKIGKEAFYRQAEMPLADAYRYAAQVMTENMMARDANEGISAFIDKRTPTWEDR
jgi:enoyl-CoA hydratase/carnithine racemase